MGSEEIKSIFGNQVRVRVMGLLIKDEKILMINHSDLNPENELWLPPGGGVKFGETTEKALVREFEEEVSMKVKVGDFFGISEFIAGGLHAIELFFAVEQIDSILRLGFDPEMGDRSILREVRWIPVSDLKHMNKRCLHLLFHDINSIGDLFAKQGFFNIGNNP